MWWNKMIDWQEVFIHYLQWEWMQRSCWILKSPSWHLFLLQTDVSFLSSLKQGIDYACQRAKMCLKYYLNQLGSRYIMWGSLMSLCCSQKMSIVCCSLLNSSCGNAQVCILKSSPKLLIKLHNWRLFFFVAIAILPPPSPWKRCCCVFKGKLPLGAFVGGNIKLGEGGLLR